MMFILKTNGALRSNYIAPNGGTLVTIDTNLAAQNADLATNTINASSTFNENVTVVNTKTLFVNDIQDASGDAIDITAGTASINGSLIDNSDAKLKYDVDLLKSNCISMIKKFKPENSKEKIETIRLQST